MATLGRLRVHRDFQDLLRERAAEGWIDNGLVFAFRVGAALHTGTSAVRSGLFLLRWSWGALTSWIACSQARQHMRIRVKVYMCVWIKRIQFGGPGLLDLGRAESADY